jgi:hypothetical protein
LEIPRSVTIVGRIRRFTYARNQMHRASSHLPAL